MQDKLADKWAVEITCLEDAKRLQALFPNTRKTVEMYLARKQNYPDMHHMGHRLYEDGSAFAFDYVHIMRFHGYTIYTIEQLENLMK